MLENSDYLHRQPLLPGLVYIGANSRGAIIPQNLGAPGASPSFKHVDQEMACGISPLETRRNRPRCLSVIKPLGCLRAQRYPHLDTRCKAADNTAQGPSVQTPVFSDLMRLSRDKDA